MSDEKQRQLDAFRAKVLRVPNPKRKTGRQWSHTASELYGMMFMETIYVAQDEPRVWWKVALVACLALGAFVAKEGAIRSEDAA